MSALWEKRWDILVHLFYYWPRFLTGLVWQCLRAPKERTRVESAPEESVQRENVGCHLAAEQEDRLARRGVTRLWLTGTLWLFSGFCLSFVESCNIPAGKAETDFSSPGFWPCLWINLSVFTNCCPLVWLWYSSRLQASQPPESGACQAFSV